MDIKSMPPEELLEFYWTLRTGQLIDADEDLARTEILRRIPRWISVQEAMPEYGTVSIVFCRDDDKGHLAIPYQELAGYSYHGGWSVGTPIREGITVTHWMPLPEPPRKAGFLKGYKHHEGGNVSDACGDGRHQDCTETFHACACTFRSLHKTMHKCVTAP